METIYLEARHSTCDGYYEPIYDKVIVEENEPIKYYYRRLGDSEWKIDETSGNADKNLHYILAATKPALLENGWIFRVMSPLEALVIFGKENEIL